MFEYKSEIVSAQPKGLKLAKTIVDHADLSRLDELINAQAADGWELVTHSTLVDTVMGHINVIATFRRAK